MQEIPVAWSHIADLESDPDSRNFSPHHRDGPKDLVANVNSKTSDGLQLKVLRAANQNAGLAEIDQVAGEVNTRAQKANQDLALRLDSLGSRSCHLSG